MVPNKTAWENNISAIYILVLLSRKLWTDFHATYTINTTHTRTVQYSIAQRSTAHHSTLHCVNKCFRIHLQAASFFFDFDSVRLDILLNSLTHSFCFPSNLSLFLSLPKMLVSLLYSSDLNQCRRRFNLINNSLPFTRIQSAYFSLFRVLFGRRKVRVRQSFESTFLCHCDRTKVSLYPSGMVSFKYKLIQSPSYERTVDINTVNFCFITIVVTFELISMFSVAYIHVMASMRPIKIT